MPLCQEVHDFCREVTWENLAWDLLWLPILVTLCLILLMVPLNRWYVRKLKQKAHFAMRIRRLVGDEELTCLHHPRLLLACFVMEICLSMWFALAWAYRTYAHELGEVTHRTDAVFCVFFMMAYTMNAARNNFTPSFALRPSSFITVVTVIPTFSRSRVTGGSSLWFSFGYLRAINAVIAVNKIEKMGALKDVGDVTLMYIQLSLRTFSVVVCLVGTVFVLEVLGDPNALQDQFIETDMGGLSVVQLTYWIFTTISTVGYGDFAPKATLSRLFVVVAIVVGVIFFSDEINEVLRVYALENSGKGRYKASQRGVDHVVLLGGGVKQFSSVMQSLMAELYSGQQERWPDLVIMASVEQPELLRQAIKAMRRDIRNRIKYYMGDPTEPEDMIRVGIPTADLVIIIPSLLTKELNAEDEANILRGLAVKNSYPKTNLRLMLLRSSNKKVAVQVGFAPSRCFSISEQKSGLFALACSCRGFSTMITHFIVTDPTDEDRPGSKGYADPWMSEYKEGHKFHLGGFLVNSNYIGISFSQFAILSTKRNITPIAVQIHGRVRLAPASYTLERGDVIFALIRDSDDITEFAESKEDWRSSFKASQRCSQKEAKDEFMHRKALIPTPAIQRKEMCKDGSGSSKDDIAKKMKMLEEKALRIAEAGGHHILVCLQGAPLQQIQVFLNTLRAPHMPVHIPIILLMPPPLPPGDQIVAIFEAFPRTAFMSSPGTPSINDLKKCGMAKARCIALLAGNAGQAQASDRRMVDGGGVTLLACIEGEIMEHDLPHVPVFLELHQQESIRFLSRYFERHADPDIEDSGFDPKESFTDHPRFANGNLFTASCFGATVARSFNMPGIVELMEAITLGAANNQSSFPWQILLPEGFDSKRYGELMQSILEGHSAVCLGLFRLCFPSDNDDEDGDGTRFVVTNPDQNVILRRSDYIFVLGNAEFGQYFFQKGLLVGTDGAPSATEPEEPQEPEEPLSSPVSTAVVVSGTLPLPPTDDWPDRQMKLDAEEGILPRLRNQALGRSDPGVDLAVIPLQRRPEQQPESAIAQIGEIADCKTSNDRTMLSNDCGNCKSLCSASEVGLSVPPISRVTAAG